MKTVSGEEQIKGIEDLGKALRSLPDEVVIDVIDHKNGTRVVCNVTEILKNNTD